MQATKRNKQRFPEDFMFQLTAEEFTTLKSQSVISNTGRGGRRTAPYAFTEQGIAMLSSVLNSPRAIAVNIEIMRTFVRVRALAISQQDFAKQLEELEAKTDLLSIQQRNLSHNTKAQFKQVFDAIRELMNPPELEIKKRPIGFVIDEEDKDKKGD